MPFILLIGKKGNLKELIVNDARDLQITLIRKIEVNCTAHHTFNLSLNNNVYSITVYGKLKGKALQENKYEFPPPIDNLLFFGNCVLVNRTRKEQNIVSLTIKEWKDVYEKLFGGFSDICSGSDDEIEDDDEVIINSMQLSKGYEKDGFVVDDDDSIDDDNGIDIDDDDNDDFVGSDDSDEDERRKKKRTAVSVKKDKKTRKSSEVYLDCTLELKAEDYFR